MGINPVMAQYGVDIASTITGFMNQRTEYKLQMALQKYRNQVVKAQASASRNRVLMNEVETRDASQRLGFALDRKAHTAEAKAEAAAAAAGIQGNNVDQQARRLRMSALEAQAARKEQTYQENRAHWEQRRDIAVSEALSKDIQVYDKPSVLSAAIGLGSKLLDTYNESLPEDQRLGATIKGMFSL